ncbi:hypothetical protein TUM12370_13490 [Salmonella enterica subsp. enterica serovar Choleraesuis]|nr:hypothetical protein TUM12370_13490 [Salmonella enterica subsp. enterica serovar Choleraesuis]
MELSHKYNRSDVNIGKWLQKAEEVINGVLIMLDISLEMDDCVTKRFYTNSRG